jgi:hypothetical protein
MDALFSCAPFLALRLGKIISDSSRGLLPLMSDVSAVPLRPPEALPFFVRERKARRGWSAVSSRKPPELCGRDLLTVPSARVRLSYSELLESRAVSRVLGDSSYVLLRALRLLPDALDSGWSDSLGTSRGGVKDGRPLSRLPSASSETERFEELDIGRSWVVVLLPL